MPTSTSPAASSSPPRRARRWCSSGATCPTAIPAYTLVQVSVNDLLMLVLFAPIVRYLVSGASSLDVPFQVLLYSVLVFIVVPLVAGVLLRQWFVRTQGRRVVRDGTAAALRACQHAGPARHARPDLRVPGRQHPRQAAARGAHRRADPDPGLLQLLADLRPDAAVPGRVRRRGARVRSSAPATSSNSRSRRPSRCSVPSPARRWRPSSACSSRCRSCCRCARCATARATGSRNRRECRRECVVSLYRQLVPLDPR